MQPRAVEDFRVKDLRVIHDDDDRCAPRKLGAGVLEDADHCVDIAPDGDLRLSLGGRANLIHASILEPEELVRVSVLLVVVDETRVGRGGDDAGWLEGKLDEPRISMEHRYLGAASYE